MTLIGTIGWIYLAGFVIFGLFMGLMTHDEEIGLTAGFLWPLMLLLAIIDKITGRRPSH